MSCECDCSCSETSGRYFLTREEKIDRLKTYKDYLEKEAKGVSEKISELQKK